MAVSSSIDISTRDILPNKSCSAYIFYQAICRLYSRFIAVAMRSWRIALGFRAPVPYLSTVLMEQQVSLAMRSRTLFFSEVESSCQKVINEVFFAILILFGFLKNGGGPHGRPPTTIWKFNTCPYRGHLASVLGKFFWLAQMRAIDSYLYCLALLKNIPFVNWCGVVLYARVLYWVPLLAVWSICQIPNTLRR